MVPSVKPRKLLGICFSVSADLFCLYLRSYVHQGRENAWVSWDTAKHAGAVSPGVIVQVPEV